MSFTRSDTKGQLEEIWSALQMVREDLIPEGDENYDAQWNEITTAMAFITEDLEAEPETTVISHTGEVGPQNQPLARLVKSYADTGWNIGLNGTTVLIDRLDGTTIHTVTPGGIAKSFELEEVTSFHVY